MVPIPIDVTGTADFHAASSFLRSVFKGQEHGVLAIFCKPSNVSHFAYLDRDGWYDNAADTAMRLRDALAGSMPAAEVAKAMRTAILEFQQKPRMAKAALDSVPASVSASAGTPAVVVDYASVSRTARSRSESLNGLASQRQPLSSRKRSASVPATSPVTKITRRASSGVAAAMAR